MPVGEIPHPIVAEIAPLLRGSSWEHIGEEPFFSWGLRPPRTLRVRASPSAVPTCTATAPSAHAASPRRSPASRQTAVQAQTAGHLTGSEAQGGCESLERLSCGDSSRVELECATFEIRVRFPVTAPRESSCHSPEKVLPGRRSANAVRQGMVGAPHKRVRDGSTPSTATTLTTKRRSVPKQDPRL